MRSALAALRRRVAVEQSGFSLVEMLLVMTLLALVLGATLGLLDTTARVSPQHQERGQVIREGQTGLERITRELRQASSVTFTSSRFIEVTTFVRGGSGASVQRRVRFDCTQLKECRRFEGPVGGTLTQTAVLARGVENTDVFTLATPRYLELTFALKIEGQPNNLFLRDGVELRNVPA